ncbi:MAG TPA: Gfo/Idh/MocA family oxidoreductase [Terriglobales bacterium]|nr:Gfo/Idh/MocA family oxidoreductase [Terriglobales bacterium]
MAKTKVAVIGAGAFGKNHGRVYHELRQEGLIDFCGIVDSDLGRAQEQASKYGVSAFSSVAALLKAAKPDAASVAVPTIHHAAVARQLMEAGVDVLIEKPIAATLQQADEILELAARHNRIGMVGHLERFNPAVRATVPLLNHPMFFEVHRLSVFTPRALDVDVVLDLMIHDLDIVLSFVPSPVKEIRAVGLPILSPKVDICNVRVEFESGCVANFTASRVSTERVRKLRFFQKRQYISVDYGRQDVLVFTVSKGSSMPVPMPATIPEHPGLLGSADLAAARQLFSGAAVLAQSGIKMEKPPVAQEEPLKAELKAFLQAVQDRSRPVVTLEEGRRALQLGLAILQQVEEHTKRFGLHDLD